ncbi:unnamed protein product [Cylicocyclus nassatus]|uniref:Uncharacterized protein n=1 Tax=Cylicocyclus nassatus TaxID=53992 RepID=A0AA36GV41_CYLNA|nr:unnamed protein product [Cylicocyclus nassatus]
MQVLVFLWLLPSCYCSEWNVQGGLFGSVQSSGVKAKLFCNDKPFTKAECSMYDEDITVDAWLDGPHKPDSLGTCVVEGTKKEISQIDPYIFIRHWCNRTKTSPIDICIDVPSEYIYSGYNAKQFYYFELELTTARGSKKCRWLR